MQNDPYLPNKYPAKYVFVICSWPGAMFKLVRPTYPPKGVCRVPRRSQYFGKISGSMIENEKLFGTIIKFT